MALLIQDKINYIKLKYVLIPRASNILRLLFRKKWLTAFNSTWSEKEEQGQQFVDGCGKNIFVTASRRRKKLLLSGRVDLWDLQLLSIVLLKLDFGSTSVKLTKKEKKAIESLADIHYDLRRSLNSIDRKEFGLTWGKIASILINLGESSDKLRILKMDKVRSMEMNNRQPASSLIEDVKDKNDLMKFEIRNLGNQFYKEEKFIEAIAVYTQSIRIQRCKIELAMLYSNRSAAYFGFKQDDILFVDQRITEVAKDDIKNAIELCPTWYKAHYRIGCFYEKLNKNKKAAKHFEIALILDPNQIEVSNKLDQVKALIKPDDPDFCKYSNKEFVGNRTMDGKCTAWKGYCYFKGIQVEKDYKMAAKLLTEAVNENNGFAMIHLADMYALGQGVRKNKKMHLELLLKAASQPEIQLNGKINENVVDAELRLGFTYHKGIGVFPEMEKAILWFKKASDHGCAKSSFNLGSMYFKGTGAIKDEDQAVYYWQIAADRNFIAAFQKLANYYLICDFDSDKALQFHRQFLAASKRKVPEREEIIFEQNIDKLRQLVDYEVICSWEAENEVSAKNVSLRDRRRRFMKSEFTGFDELVREYSEMFMKSAEDIIDDDCVHYLYKLKVLSECTSGTGKRLKQAVTHFITAARYLKTSGRLKLPIKLRIINELSSCLKLEPLVAHWKVDYREIIATFVESMLRYVDVVKSTSKIQILICYIHFHLRLYDENEMKILLKGSIEKYPKEIYFYRMFLSVLLSLKDYEEGLKQAERALKRFPKNCELLLYRAKHVQGLGKNSSRVIKAYEDFLAVAEPDHLEVPAAYYEIALVYSNLKMLHQRSAISGKVTEYYHKGLEAEERQLPCFLPYKRDKRFEILSKVISELKCRAKEKDSGIKCEESKLTDPLRVEVIKNFRGKLKSTPKSKKKKKPKLKQHAPPQLAEIKLATFKEMDCTNDHFHEDLSVSVTVIDDYYVTNGIHLLVEDENQDVMEAMIYNITMDETVAEKFAYGSEIIIMNPYMRIASSDGKPVLIVEDPKSLIFMSGGNSKLCRFCRKPNADKKFSKCPKAFYCSKECQNNDWKI
uniref:MYND-type domain-containing protein n=1 Tax=Strigamia maritima TaxID=126957 RepID=T1J236_STRMM